MYVVTQPPQMYDIVVLLFNIITFRFEVRGSDVVREVASMRMTAFI